MPRARKPKVVKFPQTEIPADAKLVQSLVGLLGEVRSGKVKGYALVCVRDDADGNTDIVMSADILANTDKLLLLGGIERLKALFVKREWPES